MPTHRRAEKHLGWEWRSARAAEKSFHRLRVPSRRRSETRPCIPHNLFTASNGFPNDLAVFRMIVCCHRIFSLVTVVEDIYELAQTLVISRRKI